jgi:signal-transduction protein with cAMP-binding, CBS, and nucleotidyltransferase domain
MAKTSTRPMVRIHDLETNEVIDREMNDEEFSQYEADQTARAEAQAEAEAKATARQAILDRLGLTAEEAALILG